MIQKEAGNRGLQDDMRGNVRGNLVMIYEIRVMAWILQAHNRAGWFWAVGESFAVW
ncbi:MAG: hypothetical protein JSV09_14835 [Thermoplasmata archaeon]|nr:MAG: hypothetical protein JSV09_14835 [Thermoplasmata archaeon]